MDSASAPSAFALALAGFFLFSSAGCEKEEGVSASAKPPAERQYEIRGILRETNPDDAVLVVEHEDVPGFMPSMTMPFHLRDAAEGKGLKKGDAISFTMFLGETNSWISGVRVLDPATIRLPAPVGRPGATSAQGRVKEGDSWPGFVLTDQDGREFTHSDFSGKYVLLNFIFVRCPVPDYCPLVSRNFSQIQSAVVGDPALAGKVSLLSVSFDPEDRPEVLKKYAATHTSDTRSWGFATGAPAEVEKLTRAFAVRIESEGGTFNHGLCTALVGPDGKVLQLWRGNGWTPAEVLQALRSLPEIPPVIALESLSPPGANSPEHKTHHTHNVP